MRFSFSLCLLIFFTLCYPCKRTAAQALAKGVENAGADAVIPQPKPEDEQKDLKILSETKDKYGNTIRKISFTKGQTRVVQTIVTPPFPSVTDRRRIDPDTLNRDSIMVLVEKSNYLVAVIYKRQRIRQYRAVFGPEPARDKMMEGDRCTPEGWFKIVAKRDHKAWQKFILLDYPNEQSKALFRQRKAQGLIPSNASIGGSIGIHGTFLSGVKMIDWGMGWTDGCVAMKPEDIEDFYRFVFPGTRVYVRR